MTSSPSNKTSSNMAIFETILGKDLWKTSEKLDKIVTLPLVEALGDKEFVILYFGGQWSSICTTFTPLLINFYKQANASKHILEVVYVSSDQSQEEFNEHFDKMPWTTMVCDTPELLKGKNDLIPLFKAFRVPCLIVLHGPTGQFITEHGMKQIQQCMSETSSEMTVSALLQQWRTTDPKSIQIAHKLIDYGGGTMSAMIFLYNNPYVIVALIALVTMTPILHAIYQKPMVLIGFMFLVQRYLTPKGEQNLPGKLLTASTHMAIEK